MKKLFLSFMLLLSTVFMGTVAAQDVITMKNGEEVKANVTEVTSSEIKYKRFDNPDGPTYTIRKSDAFMIKYKNGTKEVLESGNGSASNDEGGFWKPNLWTNQTVMGVAPYYDLGGHVATGGRLGAEFRYRRFAGDVFVKFGGLGLMNHIYLDDSDTESPSEDISGFGGGFTLKVYLPLASSHNTLYVGLMNEWSSYSCFFASDSYDSYSAKWDQCDYTGTGLGFGYGYHSGKGFFVNAGFYFGLAVANLEYTYSNHPDSYGSWYKDDDSWACPFFTLELAIGWEIPLMRK